MAANHVIRQELADRLPLRPSRPVMGRENRRIYSEVQEARLRVDGSLALAAHAMEGMLRLNAYRESLSHGDPVTNAVLSEVQTAAMQQVKAIQAHLFDIWSPR